MASHRTAVGANIVALTGTTAGADQTVCDPQPIKRLRAQNALWIYLFEIMQRDKLRGVKTKFTKQHWSTIRKDFAALPTAARASYEFRATLWADQVKRANTLLRRGIRNVTLPSVPHAGSKLALPSPPSQALACIDEAVSDSSRCTNGWEVSLPCVGPLPSRQQAAPPCAASPPPSFALAVPTDSMSPQVLEPFLTKAELAAMIRGRTLRGMVASFRAVATGTSRPTRKSVPASTAKKRPCPAICHHTHAYAVVCLKDNLVAWMGREVSRLKVAYGSVAKSDAMFRFDLGESAQHNRIQWSQLASGCGQSGFNKARANWIPHNEVGIDGDSVRLHPVLSAPYTSKCSSAKRTPYRGVECGLARGWSAERMATYLLELRSCTTQAFDVTISKHSWDFDEACPSLAGVKTCGADPLFAPVTITSNTNVVAGDVPDDDADFDYMAGSTAHTSDATGDGLSVDDLLADDALQHLNELLAEQQAGEDPMHAGLEPDPVDLHAARVDVDGRPPTDEDSLETRRSLALWAPDTDRESFMKFFGIAVDCRWNVMDCQSQGKIGQIFNIQGRCLQATCVAKTISE